MPEAYRIVQWALLYESADTRKTENMSWYKKRTKLVGLGIGKVMREAYPRNVELFGIWTLLETLATQSSPQHRGWLVRDGEPLDFDSMSALMPTVPAQAFKSACEWFIANTPGWLKLEHFPAAVPATGTPPGQPPAAVPATGTPPGQPPPRERDRESTERKRKERGTPGDSPGIPDWEEVRAWARLNHVEESYVENLFHRTTEKNGWVSNRKLIDWRKQFLRYWTEDKEEFLRKKTAAPKRAAGRPDDWKKGDQEWWWTESIENIEAAQHGAAISADKKTAARLREILASRKAK